jgi:hypothetical protein
VNRVLHRPAHLCLLAGDALTCRNFSLLPRPSRPSHYSLLCPRSKGNQTTSPLLHLLLAPSISPTTEQRFIIKEIVLKDLNVPKARAGAPETIGDPVPSNVELHDMTPELARKVPEAKSHQFYVTAAAIVLVSRSDRKVADVIVIK